MIVGVVCLFVCLFVCLVHYLFDEKSKFNPGHSQVPTSFQIQPKSSHKNFLGGKSEQRLLLCHHTVHYPLSVKTSKLCLTDTSVSHISKK